jgi:hypothetical protein
MKRRLRNDQTGMVSIIITMIMMFVIVLVVLGFAEVTRRNQREALDTQLGTQAYYAAETGVNDVVNSIKAGLTPVSSNCNGGINAKTRAGAAITLPRKLAADNSVANTCLMIDTNPGALVDASIPPTTGSVVWDVKNAVSNKFKTLTFSWRPDTSPPPPATPLDTSCPSAVGTYPPVGQAANQWKCDRAMLRVDIVRADVAFTDADNLAKNTVTLFLQPGTTDSVNPTITGFGAGNASAYQWSCKSQAPVGANNGCTIPVDLSNVAGSNAQANEYYVRITSLYLTARTVTLEATDATTGVAATFANGQIVIDSTGRAQDQIKRIKVRIPLTKSSGDVPVFALQGTGDICKDMTIPGGASIQTSCPTSLSSP